MEGAHWFYGYDTGLNFTVTQTLNGIANVPTFSAGPIHTDEGCFSLSDSEGNLLFSSDGMTVFDKLHNVMPNGTGLRGDPSSAQSGIVIPRPNNSKEYYIVTVSARLGPYNGLNYSVVNMDLNSNYGDILTTKKNIPLDYGGATIGGVPIEREDSYESITSVKHSNGKDYWLVHRSRDKFFAWHVTESGIGPSPTQVSEIGDDLGTGMSPANPTIGYLKLSPNGKYLVHAGYDSGKLTFGEFDSTTGAITNIKVFDSGTPAPYGVEFSPSGEYFYFGTLLSRSVSEPEREGDESLQRVYCVPVSSMIAGNLNGLKDIGCGIGLQLAPDNRIYTCLTNVRHLYMIENPDEGGTIFRKFEDFMPLGHTSRRGLPSFNASFFGSTELSGPEKTCRKEEVEYSIEVSQGLGAGIISYVIWDFGDGNSFNEAISASTGRFTSKKKYTYNKPGKYTLSFKPYNASGELISNKMQTLEVIVNPCVIPVNPNIHLYY